MDQNASNSFHMEIITYANTGFFHILPNEVVVEAKIFWITDASFLIRNPHF